MVKVSVVSLALVILASLGCETYMTHKEIGFRRLISVDVESIPTATNGQTVPLIPAHATHKPLPVGAIPSLPKAAAPTECVTLPAIKCVPTRTESVSPPCTDATAAPAPPNSK